MESKGDGNCVVQPLNPGWGGGACMWVSKHLLIPEMMQVDFLKFTP